VTLVAHFAEGKRRIACGRGKWQPERAAWGSLAEQPMAASGGWTEDNTFTAKLCCYQTPFSFTVKRDIVDIRVEERRFEDRKLLDVTQSRRPL
jgi:hypothetical protein